MGRCFPLSYCDYFYKAHLGFYYPAVGDAGIYGRGTGGGFCLLVDWDLTHYHLSIGACLFHAVITSGLGIMFFVYVLLVDILKTCGYPVFFV